MSQHYVIVVTKDGEVPVPVPSPEDNEDGKPVEVRIDYTTSLNRDNLLRIGTYALAVAEFLLAEVVGWYRTVKDEEDEDV